MGHIIHSIVQYPRPLYKKVYLVIISAVTLRIVKFTLRLVKLTDFTNNPINNLIVEYLYIYHILLARVNHNSISLQKLDLDFIGVTLSLPSLLVLPVLSGDRWGLGNQIVELQCLSWFCDECHSK